MNENATKLAELLKYESDYIHGGMHEEIAEDWDDHAFGEDAQRWWDEGFFDAGSAAELRDAGYEHWMELTYTGTRDIGDPVEAFCNSDISIDDLEWE